MKTIPGTKQDYENSKVEAVQNSTEWYDWLKENWHDKIIILFNRKKEDFQNLFGKHSFCVDYWQRNWVWKFEYKGFFFWILSSTRGPAYETNCIDKKIIIEFMQEIYELLKANKNADAKRVY